MKKIITTLFLAATFLSSASEAALESRLPEVVWNEYENQMNHFRGKQVAGAVTKIQDLVDVAGEETVKLQGFGVVSGLNGTGDKSAAATKLLVRVADKQGIRLSEGDIKAGNLAVVSISAEVSPHQRNFDISVKSISDAKSLQNGFLEASTLTPIGSSDVYGVASGSIALGARYFAAEAADGAIGGTTSVTVGHPTMGFVLEGGELTRELPSHRLDEGQVKLYLKHPDGRTAANISNTINRYMETIGVQAQPTNPSLITVTVPSRYYSNPGDLTRLIADIGDLSSDVGRKAMITIDQGSGVIAMTEGVKIEPGLIAVAGLTVSVRSDITPVTRQGWFEGETAFMDIPDLEVSEDVANFLTLPAGTDLMKVQETFNALKLQPTSLISVLNAMHEAGMIHAEIVVMPR